MCTALVISGCCGSSVVGRQARDRLRKATVDLADAEVSVTIGVTQLKAQDTLSSVITRADDAMYAQRR